MVIYTKLPMLIFHGFAIKLKVKERWAFNYYNIIISIPGHMDDETAVNLDTITI